MTGPTRAGPAETSPPVAAPAFHPSRRAFSLAPRSGWPHGSRLVLGVLGFAIYVGSIAGANWMISHVGRPVEGAHVLPVGFGLEAPSGVYLAGLTFVARDIVQRLVGLRVGVLGYGPFKTRPSLAPRSWWACGLPAALPAALDLCAWLCT